MSAARKVGSYPSANDLTCNFGTDNTSAHRQNVRVIVLAAHFRRINFIAQRTAYALDFIRRNGNANAGAAKDNPSIRRAADNFRANFFRNVRIINRLFAEGANVLDLDAFKFCQNFLDFFFEVNCAVIAANRNFHVKYSSQISCRSIALCASKKFL